MKALLTAIVSVGQLGSPPTHDHPGVELVAPAEITFMRYKAFSSEKRAEIAALQNNAALSIFRKSGPRFKCDQLETLERVSGST